MLVLGIESSCDDTSVALLECSEQGLFVVNEKTASQIEVHKKYGGVVPEIAGRMHAEKIVPLIEAVLTGTNGERLKPDVIAVTAGPGLVTGLVVGVEAARALSFARDIRVVATNHLSGHIHSVEIKNTGTAQEPNTEIIFPALALLVSGGHTELILMKSHTEYERLGHTADDAAGECFDKVAKLLGFPYPGGPQISKQALGGNPDAIRFPRPMLDQDNFNFSFSGLKTAALYWLRDHNLAALSLIPPPLPAGMFGQVPAAITVADFCASFEQAIVDVLVTKTIKAAKQYQPHTIILAGGVAANKRLRDTLGQQIAIHIPNSKFQIPTFKYCMDNGAMIAAAGYYLAVDKKFTHWKNLHVDPNWKIDKEIEKM